MNSNFGGIPATFLRYASDIVGDTQKGLSATKIIEATVAYAVEYDVAIRQRACDLVQQYLMLDAMCIKTQRQQFLVGPPKP